MTSKTMTAPDRKDLSIFPTLSLAERDDRWSRTRAMMAANDVECLLVLPDNPVDRVDSWFTNDTHGAVVLFPLAGEPTAVWSMGATWSGAWLMEAERGEQAWVEDWRFSPGAVVGALREKGLANARIGTIGMSEGGVFAPKGNIPHHLWQTLHEALPGVEWVSLVKPFVPIWLTKSTEDLALFRHGAAIIEEACRLAVELARPGINELELYSRVQYEIRRHGATAFDMFMYSGRENIGHYVPKWLSRSQNRRTIEDGDTVHMEIFANIGAAHVQAQQAIAVGEPDVTHARAARLARLCYEIGLDALRPGARFADVAAAMRAPAEREGAWQLTPMLHSVSPLYCVDQPTRGIENMTGLTARFRDLYEGTMMGGDIVLAPGMVFAFEPNAAFGRDYVDVGGMVLVTEDGCEELNRIPTRLRVGGAPDRD